MMGYTDGKPNGGGGMCSVMVTVKADAYGNTGRSGSSSGLQK